MLGSFLIYSSILTYLVCWIVYFVLVSSNDISVLEKGTMFTYCLVPWTLIMQSGTGGLINMVC